jgi:multiple sugar transport system ATP-binding protein
LFANPKKVFRSQYGSLPVPSGTAFETGRKLIYGLRPQHIKVLADSSEADSGIIEARLMLSETTGTETQFSFDFGGRKLIVANQGRFDIPLNSKCRLKIDAERAHFFDQESQQRIEGH